MAACGIKQLAEVSEPKMIFFYYKVVVVVVPSAQYCVHTLDPRWTSQDRSLKIDARDLLQKQPFDTTFSIIPVCVV